MKRIVLAVAILGFSLMLGAYAVRADYQVLHKQRADSTGSSPFRLPPVSTFLQDSVTQWNPISNSNMSFGRMTMYENRNSSKITWRSGQSSPYTTISDDEDGAVLYLTAAPNFDGDRCRYLKMVFNENDVTVDFFATKNDLDQNNFFMEGTYEQVK